MSRSKKVLIASGSGDEPNFRNVANLLTQAGYTVTIFEPNSIAKGSRSFSAHLDKHGQLTFTYDNQPFVPGKFAAAWHRKPDFYGKFQDRLRWLSLKDEYRALHFAMWQTIPSSIWLNHPDNIRQAGVKLPQLKTAASLGFTVPETIISNSWDTVESMDHKKLVVKMATSHIVPSENGDILMPTTVLDRDNLPKNAKPYPGIWQPYIEKKREWRITVVGDRVFSAAIYTEPDAKDDWRKHQFSSKVVFKKEDFPESEQKKCKALLKHYGLRYGAFDFVETPDGQIVFLEVNPNGQFMWLEDQLGLPISEAIAAELIRIAKSH